MPNEPQRPPRHAVPFRNSVCTTTRSASVAIAIVDSVIRMMPPPKIAARTADSSADAMIAGR